MKTYKDYLRDYLIYLSDEEYIDQWNGYCLDNGMGDYINDNDENFFKDYFHNDINEAVRAVCYGDYRYFDEYVVFNVYGNLESFNSYELLDHANMDELIDYLEENDFLKDEYLEFKEV